MSLLSVRLYVAESEGKGRGVYCAEDIQEGELIEICPVIVFSPADLKLIHETALHDYYFLWGDDSDHGAIALGMGSLYNHDREANARYYMNFEEKSIEIVASRFIESGEEIFINYNGGDSPDGKVWFE